MTFLLHLLETEENEKIQALLCMGIAKLMLAGMITDERVGDLLSFAVAYGLTRMRCRYSRVSY